MNSLKRFLALGVGDADARVERFFAPRSFTASDQYLRSSAVVRAVDGATRRLHAWGQASLAGQALRSLAGQWRRDDWTTRHRVIAVVLLSAATVNVLLTTLNGPRPGWFWLIVPGLAAAMAAVLLTGSRTQPPQ